MKTQVESRKSKVESKQTASAALRPRPSTLDPRRAFTLIELLVVITIIATLAAFLVPVIKGVNDKARISRAQAELAQIETAIESYHAAYGYYPPDNPGNPLTNQLYYELVGTKLMASAPPTFQVLDGVQTLTQGDIETAFNSNVHGFINCTKSASAEDAAQGKDFLHTLNPNQLGTVNLGGVSITNLVTAVGGPDINYRPLGAQGVNPWRYNSSHPTNNPGSYELWVQLKMGSKTNLVCNWSKRAIVNSPLP